jgi:CheY-like chemotaxis protein
MTEKFADNGEFSPVARLLEMIAALSGELSEHPRQVETRMLRSLIQGVDTLSLLFDNASRKRAASGAASHVLLLGCDQSECGPLAEALAATGFQAEFGPDLKGGLGRIKNGSTGLICIDNENLGDDTPAICRSLKSGLKPSHPPVLLITNSSPVAEWGQWSASGVSDFIMKPASPSELKLKAISLVYRAAIGSK